MLLNTRVLDGVNNKEKGVSINIEGKKGKETLDVDICLVVGEVVDVNVGELVADSLDDVQEVAVGDVVQGETHQLAELSPTSKSSRQSSAPRRS